jgi:hypothetical protein
MLSIIRVALSAFAQRNAHPKERKHVVQKRNIKVVVRRSVYRPKVMLSTTQFGDIKEHSTAGAFISLVTICIGIIGEIFGCIAKIQFG